MFHPERDPNGKNRIRARLEAPKPATFDEFKAGLTESKRRLVIPEARSGNPAERDIGEARRVAVAALEAEIDRSADGQNIQIPIPKKRGGYGLGQNPEGAERVRVAHHRKTKNTP